MPRRQLIHIHGGEFFPDYATYLEFLHSYQLDPSGETPSWWKHHLREDLGEGWEVVMPEMPSPLNARYGEWRVWFEKYLPYLREGVCLMGHSLGAMFLSRYLSEEELEVEVSALFLLAGEYRPQEGNLREDDFYPREDKLPRLSAAAGEIYLLHSRDDPVVAYGESENLARALPGSHVVTLEDRGHLVTESFPELLTLIRNTGS